MNEAYENKLLLAKKNQKEIKKKINNLRQLRKGDVDRKIHQQHDSAFQHIDCLQCANCCKTTGPLFTQNDIERISRRLNLSPRNFTNQYLYLDEDNDLVLKFLPCPFLGPDNYCSIYEDRPKACQKYPHTNEVNQLRMLKHTAKNVLICPAVADIFENIAL